jgi:hypothetical protein
MCAVSVALHVIYKRTRDGENRITLLRALGDATTFVSAG